MGTKHRLLRRPRAQSREEVIARLREAMPYLRTQYGVRKLALYGSFRHDTPRRTSDVDLIIDTERPLGLEFIELADYLEQLLGRRVDLTTFACLQRALQHPVKHRIADVVQRSLLYVE